jgi:hypothetical protein
MYVGEKKFICLWWEKNPNLMASILSYTDSYYVYINIMLCHIYTVTDPDERSKEETERKYLELCFKWFSDRQDKGLFTPYFQKHVITNP